jgi:hypothetical protein
MFCAVLLNAVAWSFAQESREERVRPADAKWSIVLPSGWQVASEFWTERVNEIGKMHPGSSEIGPCVLRLWHQDGRPEIISFHRRPPLQAGLSTRFFDASQTKVLPWDQPNLKVRESSEEMLMCIDRQLNAFVSYPGKTKRGVQWVAEFIGRDERVYVMWASIKQDAAVDMEMARALLASFKFDPGYEYVWREVAADSGSVSTTDPAPNAAEPTRSFAIPLAIAGVGVVIGSILLFRIRARKTV